MFKGILEKLRGQNYQVYCSLLILMLLIHQHIFLYADDLYYSRDAAYGLGNLPNFMLGQLNANGRVWIGTIMLAILKYQIYVYRFFNPIVIMLTAYLIAKISTSYKNNQKSIINNTFLVASLGSCLFFIFLPIEIANTTLYYAACAFNYLYPTALVLLYGYMLHKHYAKLQDQKTNIWILILAFLVGSSTQQVGAMGIGYTVLITAYLRFMRKKTASKSFIPYYIAVFSGYSFVTYGSVKRMLFEKQTGHVANLKDIASGLLKTNIFSVPASGYVLIIGLCCIAWLYFYNTKSFNKLINLCNNFLIFTLILGLLGYIYVVLYKNYSIHLFFGGNLNTLLSICLIVFTLVYLTSILYTSLLVLINERYPFLFYSSINAIGAQLMLFVADARFAEAYKIMFPSLLLMSIFIVYSLVNFYRNKVFLLLAMILMFLSLNRQATLSGHFRDYVLQFFVIVGLIFLGIIIRYYKSPYFKGIIAITVILLGLCNFGTEYHGYKRASYVQNFNIDSIKRYHANPNPNILMIKKVPVTRYGYNVNNWNSMPYFMKQCYGIPEETLIKYYK